MFAGGKNSSNNGSKVFAQKATQDPERSYDLEVRTNAFDREGLRLLRSTSKVWPFFVMSTYVQFLKEKIHISSTSCWETHFI
jgi:hypothetical protein